MDIAATLGNAVSGGLLGGLMSLGNAGIEFANQRMKSKEDLELKKAEYGHDLQMTQLQMDSKQQEAEQTVTTTILTGKISEMQASFEGLTKSFDDQIALSNKVTGPIQDILALFRPGLTLTLIGGTIAVGCFGQDDMFSELIKLAAMATAWWFGDRQRTKFMEGR